MSSATQACGRPRTQPERLRSSRAIREVLRGRARRAGSTTVLHVGAPRPDGPVRIAVVASRKVGAAVARNRAKRLLREAARTVTWRAGLDVVLVARRGCGEADLLTVCADLQHLATRLDVADACGEAQA